MGREDQGEVKAIARAGGVASLAQEKRIISLGGGDFPAACSE
ncbi:hypothetical protein [Acetobacter senegalensis]|nr:hypothetical protein [Acetobacter senegalensis]MDN7352175.1 hypothetical protein [Acetobacter senegalensis]